MVSFSLGMFMGSLDILKDYLHVALLSDHPPIPALLIHSTYSFLKGQNLFIPEESPLGPGTFKMAHTSHGIHLASFAVLTVGVQTWYHPHL